MRIGNWKVGVRLGVGFGIALIFMSVIAVTAIYNMGALNAVTNDIVARDWPKNKLVIDALDNARGSMARVLQIAITRDKQDAAKAFERFNANEKKFTESIEKVTSLLQRAEAKELLDKAKAARDKYVAGAQKVLKLVQEDQREEAIRLAGGEVYDSLHAFAGSLRSLMELQQKFLEESGARSETTYAASRTVMIAVAAAAFLLSVLFGWWVTRSITRPLGIAVGVAERVAAGDLTARVEATTTDETGALLRALQTMNGSLTKIATEVRGGTDAIMSASTQIASGNADLSQRTEEQASSLEETASSMEELAGTVRQNAENAKQANALAASSSELAAQGGVVVGEVVNTMSAINESSKRIAEIISVIDGIAFQTNILALNAAVEAARAGEQGRGFAVVASEVRTLAQRSSSAAKEIRQLISDSVGKVEAGSRLVDDAGKTMADIVSSVQRVTAIVADIAAATVEQSAGIEQVNQAVTQMDQVTQQNAALVEEAAAAAESMRDQAAQLGAAVAVFKLSEAAGASARPPVPEMATADRAPASITRLPTGKAVASAARSGPVAAKKTGTDDWSEF